MAKRKESMDDYAKRRGNEMEMKEAKKEAAMAPKNTTGMGKKKKMSPAAKGGSMDWGKGMKMPKGGGK